MSHKRQNRPQIDAGPERRPTASASVTTEPEETSWDVETTQAKWEIRVNPRKRLVYPAFMMGHLGF